MRDDRPRWGGAGRNQGRKPLNPSDPTVSYSVRLTQSQRDKLVALGGAAWVRERIEKARQP